MWLLLGLSVIFFIISLINKSQKLMNVSILCMIPNVMVVLMEDVEIIVLYSFLLWFSLQFFMLSRIIKKESLKSINDNFAMKVEPNTEESKKKSQITEYPPKNPNQRPTKINTRRSDTRKREEIHTMIERSKEN
jgi:hypothetical protein